MRRTVFGVILLLLLSPPWAVAQKLDSTNDVPKEVRALEGTYTGAWTMFGIDEKGEVVKRMSWTDTVKAGNSKVEGNRAYTTITDEMTFEGAPRPFKTEGKEGYFLNKDGTLGECFIETNGQVNRLAKLADNVWTYTTAANEQELGRLGFPKGAAGQHVVVKVVTKEQGVETHHISRVSTVTWKDKDGKERALQFVSLQGHHKKER